MNSGILPAETPSDEGGLETGEPLRAVIIYDGVAHGKRALQLFTGIINRAGQRKQVQPGLWPVGLLTNPAWSQVSAEEAVRADILVIAAEGPLARELRDWITSVLGQKRGTPGAVVALRGGSLRDATEAGWAEVESAAIRAGLAYFASGTGSTGKDSRRGSGGAEWAVCAE